MNKYSNETEMSCSNCISFLICNDSKNKCELFKMNSRKITKQEEDIINGLKISIAIIDNEMEFAKQVNPVMALGMEQIRRRILNQIELTFKEGI